MPPAVLQGDIVLMALALAIGAVFDLLHGQKIRFFLQARQQAKTAATQTPGAAEDLHQLQRAWELQHRAWTSEAAIFRSWTMPRGMRSRRPVTTQGPANGN